MTLVLGMSTGLPLRRMNWGKIMLTMIIQ